MHWLQLRSAMMETWHPGGRAHLPCFSTRGRSEWILMSQKGRWEDVGWWNCLVAERNVTLLHSFFLSSSLSHEQYTRPNHGISGLHAALYCCLLRAHDVERDKLQLTCSRWILQQWLLCSLRSLFLQWTTRVNIALSGLIRPASTHCRSFCGI